MGAMDLEQSVRIPVWVKDLDSFRRWSRSDEFPEHGRLSHLAGELWVDLSMERAAHNRIKGVLSEEVGRLVRDQELGRSFHDGMRLVHVGAEISTEPDGMFVSHDALDTGRVVLEEGDEALEVV